MSQSSHFKATLRSFGLNRDGDRAIDDDVNSIEIQIGDNPQECVEIHLYNRNGQGWIEIRTNARLEVQPEAANAIRIRPAPRPAPHPAAPAATPRRLPGVRRRRPA